MAPPVGTLERLTEVYVVHSAIPIWCHSRGPRDAFAFPSRPAQGCIKYLCNTRAIEAVLIHYLAFYHISLMHRHANWNTQWHHRVPQIVFAQHNVRSYEIAHHSKNHWEHLPRGVWMGFISILLERYLRVCCPDCQQIEKWSLKSGRGLRTTVGMEMVAMQWSIAPIPEAEISSGRSKQMFRL